MTTLADIERLTHAYSQARDTLRQLLAELDAETKAVKRRRLPAIRRAQQKAVGTKEALYHALDLARHLFDKPRTQTIAGIRVGVKKDKGVVAYTDAERVISAIRRHCPDQFNELVIVRYSVDKNALAKLPGSLLKKLGVEITADSDAVYINAGKTDLDKLLDALMAEADDLMREAA